ncbi:unnamed protein product, partial [Scytosiphon promiscuus]
LVPEKDRKYPGRARGSWFTFVASGRTGDTITSSTIHSGLRSHQPVGQASRNLTQSTGGGREGGDHDGARMMSFSVGGSSSIISGGCIGLGAEGSSSSSSNPGRTKKRGGKARPGGKEKKATIRKSCDFCNKRKKKCDGDGIKRCSYCVAKNNPHCIFSPRRPQKPRARNGTPATAASASPAATTTTAATQRSADAPTSPDKARSKTQRSAETAAVAVAETALARPQATLKRGRFGASLATGLVGMQESAFLGDFFGCMGFLPLTCQSTVREAMVKLFLARTLNTNEQRQPGSYSSSINSGSCMQTTGTTMITNTTVGGGSWNDHPAESTTSIVPRGTAAASLRPTPDAQQHEQSDPSICIFWCAVALGGLTQGRPVRSMAPYIRLAENALSGDVLGNESAVARAWALMAYLYGFCGDSENFRNCQRRAEEYFLVSEMEGEQDAADRLEFELLIQHADGLDLFYGDGSVSLAHVKAYLDKCDPHPQLDEAATSDNMCRFVMRSYRSFGQAFFNDVLGKFGQRSAAAVAQARRGLAEAQEAAGAGGHADSSRSDLFTLLCGDDDDDDDDMFDGDGGGGGSNALTSPVPTTRVSGGFDIFGGGFHAAANGLVNGHHNSIASHGDNGGADASNASNGASGYHNGGDGWSMQEKVEQKKGFVICGEQAITPPAHGSTYMQRAMEEATPEYERLQRAVDGPGVRGGIGGLMINCTSVVLKAAKGDIPATLEKISLCVEALERFPGLIRFPMGLHMSHLLITILAALEEQPLYTRLMRAYNPLRPPESKPIPPFEEWHGIADLCSHVYCR